MGLFGNKKQNEKEKCCCGAGLDSAKMEVANACMKEGASVKILGSGCAKCNELEQNTISALKLLEMDTSIDHVKDFSQIAAFGVMTTPALVIDGKVVSYGKVLKTEEIVQILKSVR